MTAVFPTAMETTRAAVPNEARRVFAFGAVGCVANVATSVARFIAVEVVKRHSAARREGTMIAVVWVIPVIYVAVETMRAMEPWASAKEDAASKPIRTVVAVGSAVVRRVVEIAVRADWRRTKVDTDGYLSAVCAGSSQCQRGYRDRRQGETFP